MPTGKSRKKITEKEFFLDIATRLRKEIRKEWGDQKAWAERLGVAENSLSYYLTGQRRPPLEFFCTLSDQAGVSINWLLTGEGPRVLPAPGAFLEESRLALEEEIAKQDNQSARTPEERELLDRFRALSPGVQAMMLGGIRLLAKEFPDDKDDKDDKDAALIKKLLANGASVENREQATQPGFCFWGIGEEKAD